MSLVLHLTYYPLVVLLIPLIVLFLLPKILFLYRNEVWDGGLASNVSLTNFINYRSLHMLARLWILHLIHAQLGHPTLAKMQQLIPSLSNVSSLSCVSHVI